MGCQAEKRRGDGGGSPRGIRPMLGTGEGPGVARENEPPGPTSAWHGMAGPGRSSFGSTLQQNIGGCRWDLDKDMGGAVLLLQLAAGLPQESRMRKKAASTVLQGRLWFVSVCLTLSCTSTLLPRVTSVQYSFTQPGPYSTVCRHGLCVL